MFLSSTLDETSDSWWRITWKFYIPSKKKERSHFETYVRHFWKIDSWTIRWWLLEGLKSAKMQEWETTENWCKVRCAQADVTTMQQHYTGPTSTPPRVARLCQIRDASLVALKNFTSTHAHKCRSFDSSNPSHSYPEISTVTRRHCTICQVMSSRSAQYPWQALISICGIAHVPALSFRCHSDSHRSWLMTSSRLAPCFYATARAVLLSALACIRNDNQISLSMARAKINSADSAPRAYISDSPLDKATVTYLSSTFTRQEKLSNVTQSARCAFLRHWITSPVSVSVRISCHVFQGLVQFIWFQCRYRQIEIQLLCSFQISQHFVGTCQSLQVLVTKVRVTSILSRTSNLVSLQ